MAGLPPKGTYRTYKGWMGGQPGTLENQTKTNAKPGKEEPLAAVLARD